jgi:ABC-type transporter Mla subunit MlaD
MTPDRAHLASTASSLDELIRRVTQAADDLAASREDLAADLYEVERSLRTGSRRLASVLRRLDG